MTLRRRLVLTILALLAAVSLVIATVSVLTLRGFLTGRLDNQLQSAAGRSQEAVRDPGRNGRPGASGFLALPGQPEGTIGAIISGGRLFNGAVLDRSGSAAPITQEQAQRLSEVPPDGEPRSIGLGGELGDYRVIVVQATGDDRLVIGLPMKEVDGTVLQLLGAVALVAGLGLVTAGLAATLLVRWSLRPLGRVVAAATRVSELPLDRGEVALAVRVPDPDADPRTEVGQVGAAINRMLGHISAALTARQASEKKVRNFVADASHELRTPLASIRGYAELTRRGNHTLPPDVVRALGRVESEAIRMSELVDELLLLARLDAGRELDRSEFDLATLVADAVSDARAIDAEHEWEIVVPSKPVSITGDRGRLHQVLTNLLANARIHTPAGTAVSAVLTERSGEAVIEVQDDGPGIEPDLLPSVFERFVRGDGSRSRSAGSTGLGLAIVSAVVEAHGGRTEVESTRGSTTFRVLLPLTDPLGARLDA